MRILRVISSMNPSAGGPCQGIRNMIPAMAGTEQEVVCLDDPQAGFLGSDPFPVHSLGPARSSWAYAPGLLPWLRKNLERFDVVIQHGLWQYPGVALRKAMGEIAKEGRKAGREIRYFVYPHGMLDPWFQKAESRRIKAIRNSLYWWLIEKRVVNSADGLFFTCEEEMRLAATTFPGYRPKSVHNVDYGIPEPPDNIDAQRAAFTGQFPDLVDKPFLLFLSRIHPKKGVDLLLQAYGALKKEGKVLPPLVIAGPCNDEAYWNKLQSLAISIGLQSTSIPYPNNKKNLCVSASLRENIPNSLVLWPGMLTGDLKWGTLRAASAFILPSHQENFGIAVVEALACGTPVLISDKVNIWREIERDNAGIVEGDTLEGTVRLIQQFKNSGSSLDGDRARECFQKHFSIATAAPHLSETLKTAKPRLTCA